ncbi:hypothetical protein F0562_010480 [Nyssa sinensis]|uniref:Pyruvate dehydrogenase E1 component subunit beta n=1 Tax=Nyssa sinensis TaxID=561372 RepID=A0A5J5A1E0_9ASTE|nr:hypothetical protein F0562_010480 [Nyssa sinensis]
MVLLLQGIAAASVPVLPSSTSSDSFNRLNVSILRDLMEGAGPEPCNFTAWIPGFLTISQADLIKFLKKIVRFTVPVVIRGPGGVVRQLGAEHSQRLESYFQSIPGLQMVACSTPYNAKERIPDEEYVLSLEEAEMVRPGEHVTVLTYSRMRSLKPFDLYTIGNSVKKTHLGLIAEECMRTGGIVVSLTAAIRENFRDYLDASIVCLSSQDVPTPYAGTLQEWTVVQPAEIVAAVEQLCILKRQHYW